jgi:cytochrome c-type biogenesis protein CcmH
VIALFVVLTAMALGAGLLLVLPVLRAGRVLPERARYDTAVYRDQLKELERDIARGLIGEAEAQSARLEIERRLLAAAGSAPEGTAATRRSPALAVVVVLLVAGGAAGLYGVLGAPGVPDAPFALRVAGRGAPAGDAANHPDMAKMATTLAEKLHRDPNNREGWQIYARTLAALGNWQGSADAYRNLIALGTVGPEIYAGYGEMLVLGSEGVVTPAAREAFGNAVKADAANAVARFYLALADAQAGHGQQAIDAWLKLAGETSDEDMRGEIARRITETAKLSGLTAPALPPAPPAPEQASGPGGEQIAAAAGMSEADRSTMIKGMVAQLATRLEANPNDADGWMRLGHAYAVLAQPDKSADAYEHAAALRPGDASVLMQGFGAMMDAQKPDAPIPLRAVDLLRRAEQVDPKRPEILWYLGVAEAQSGHADAALDYWRRVLDLLPADSEDRKTVTDAIEAVNKH